MATVNREKRFNTAQGILYLLADGDNCVEICSAEETVREFEMESLEQRDLFYDYAAMNLFVYSAKGLLSDENRFWEVIKKIEAGHDQKNFSTKDVYVIDNEGFEEVLPKLRVAYQLDGVDLEQGNFSLMPGAFSMILPNGETFTFDFYRHYGNNISNNEAEFTLHELEVDYIVDSNDYFPANWDELRDAVAMEVFLDAYDNDKNTSHGTGHGAKVTKFEIVSENENRIYCQIKDKFELEALNNYYKPYILEHSNVIKALLKQGFELERMSQEYNVQQIITSFHLKGDTPISHFTIVHGEKYYEPGVEQCANVYCGPSGDTKYGVWFTSIGQLSAEIKTIELQFKEEYQS